MRKNEIVLKRFVFAYLCCSNKFSVLFIMVIIFISYFPQIPISALKAVSSFLSNTAANTNVSVQKSATIQAGGYYKWNTNIINFVSSFQNNKQEFGIFFLLYLIASHSINKTIAIKKHDNNEHL